MTDDGQCARIRQELGVYVLGAIEPGQRAVVGRHLAACPRCRAELAELAELPGLLRRVPADDLIRMLLDDVVSHVPDPPLGALLGRMSRVRRRRRYLTVAAVSAVGVAGALGWQALRRLAGPRRWPRPGRPRLGPAGPAAHPLSRP